MIKAVNYNRDGFQRWKKHNSPGLISWSLFCRKNDLWLTLWPFISSHTTYHTSILPPLACTIYTQKNSSGDHWRCYFFNWFSWYSKWSLSVIEYYNIWNDILHCKDKFRCFGQSIVKIKVTNVNHFVSDYGLEYTPHCKKWDINIYEKIHKHGVWYIDTLNTNSTPYSFNLQSI